MYKENLKGIFYFQEIIDLIKIDLSSDDVKTKFVKGFYSNNVIVEEKREKDETCW